MINMKAFKLETIRLMAWSTPSPPIKYRLASWYASSSIRRWAAGINITPTNLRPVYGQNHIMAYYNCIWHIGTLGHLICFPFLILFIHAVDNFRKVMPTLQTDNKCDCVTRTSDTGSGISLCTYRIARRPNGKAVFSHSPIYGLLLMLRVGIPFFASGQKWRHVISRIITS